MHAFVDVPPENVETARAFWSAVTGWPTGPQWSGHPEFVSLIPPTGTPYLHIQAIDGAPRIHLDLAGDPERDPARLEQLGASRGPRGDRGQVMTSPTGLPLGICAQPSNPKRPGATGWPGRHRSRVVQLSVDVPHQRLDAELTFWGQATGWADEPVRGPDFHRLVHRAESPVQLLVQQLGRDDGATQARAHLDLGTDDVGAEVARV
jgi:Glyoxalase-like domain